MSIPWPRRDRPALPPEAPLHRAGAPRLASPKATPPAADDALEALSWPLPRLGEALAELARQSGLLARGAAPAASAPPVPEAVLRAGGGELDRWMVWAAQRQGLEAEAVDSPVPEVQGLLRQAGPALLRLPARRAHDGRVLPAGVLLLLGRQGRWLRLLGPEGRTRRVALAAVRDALCDPEEAPLQPELRVLLARAQVPAGRLQAAQHALLTQRLSATMLAVGWLLRLPAGGGFWAQLVQAGLPRRLGTALALYGAVYALEIAGWRLIGSAALDGRLDLGWLQAWVLLLLSVLPLQLMGSWLIGTLALDGARLFKQRLLAGALRMPMDSVTRQGAGQLLGRVMEAQALEGLALQGGLAVGVALLELVFAGWILAQGAAAGAQVTLLVLWLLASAALCWRYDLRLRQWTLQRLDLTHALLERMVGHRTRLAQEQPQRRDAAEDRGLAALLHSAEAMDRAMATVAAGVPAGWMVLGLLGLAPALVSGGQPPAALAVSLGGLLFGHRAFSSLAGGLAALSRAGVAWGQAGALFRAGVDPEVPAAAPFISGVQVQAAARPGTPLLDASQLHFAHGNGQVPVLQGLDLQIHPGDRLLLQGPSGGGKSTLAALLVGLRQPDSGLLLLAGLDRHTLGEHWHALATEAPQFHENHVLGGTLAFNLLMGHHWPASEAELAEARALCSELGLDDLIERMPAGLNQRVGETGWQLSHGERSRLFLARALLQRAPLTVLDESFAALDPPTLRLCLDCALRRAHSLLVIAHP